MAQLLASQLVLGLRTMLDVDHEELVHVPWRTGYSIGRTIYACVGRKSEHDPLIGVMDSPELAAAVVRAHNATLDAR